MKTSKKLIALIMTVFFTVTVACVSACGVVPVAWVSLQTESGYVTYTSDMYGNTGAHVYLYEDDTRENKLMEISFYPRILGHEERDGVETTLVDITNTYAMYITVYKTNTNSIYSADKEIYLNGEKLTAERSDDTYASFKSMEYHNFGLIRGNPNGRINDVVNYIEYK